jgi:hypothetical protein
VLDEMKGARFSLDALMISLPWLAGSILFLALAALCVALFFYYRRSRQKTAMRQAPGSKIALAVNEGFAPSDRFAGFVHEESGTSIALMELPLAAFDQLKELEHADETFAAQGVSGVETLPLPHRAGEYFYLRGEQNTPLVEYAKYIFIFQENGITAMVSANIPRAALNSGIMTGAEIEKIFASAAVLNEAPKAPALFSLSYLGSFEEDLSVLGTTKGYRLKRGEAAGGAAFEPMFLVAPSLTIAPVPNLALLAERTFGQIDHIQGKTAETAIELQIAGLPAVETVGRGTDAGTGKAAFVYQLMIEARHGGYYRLIGLAPEANREMLLPQFRKIAEGFRPAG